MADDRNYHNAFYAMTEKVDNLFSKYEKTIAKPEKNEGTNYNASVNHEGGGEYRLEPPSPYFGEIFSSFSSRHSIGRKTHKIPFFKLDVKFDLSMFSGESNAENIDKWIKQVELYSNIQIIKEDEAKICLAPFRLSSTVLVWWEGKLQKGGKSSRKLISSWSEFVFALRGQFYPLDYRHKAMME